MRWTRCVVIFGVVVAGCGSNSGGSGSSSGPGCAEALANTTGKTGKDHPELVAPMVEECERSGWTLDQRTCLANAKSDHRAMQCLDGPEVSERARSKQAEIAARNAAIRVAQARRDAATAAGGAQDRARKRTADLAELTRKLAGAEQAVAAANTDADRAAARARLEELQREQRELEQRLAADQADSARMQRRSVPQECLDTPLAKGCP